MELTDYARFIFALLFVLALMGGLYMALQYFTNKGSLGSLKLNAKRRLKIIEVLPIDQKHKAVLISRDGVTEHLVILGASSETILETNIIPPASETPS
jgi:flagellar protein FliO/FliZ